MLKKFPLLLLLLSPFLPLRGYELGIASMFRNGEKQLEEWIVYHRMIGVDHFWLYNDESDDGSLAVLEPFIKEGLVEVIPWPAAKPFWGVSQRNAAKDGIKKALETKTKWIAFIDLDEFILPLVDKNLSDCLNNRYKHAHAIYANWRNFGTNHVTLSKGEPILFSLTACSSHNYTRNWVGKSIVRPESVQIDRIHYVHHYPLKEGLFYSDGSANRTKMRNNQIDHDAKVNDRYLRINHYPLLDEKYFHEVRVPRDKSIGRGNDSMKWYEAFNQEQDLAICTFIKKFHPKEYSKFWKKKR